LSPLSQTRGGQGDGVIVPPITDSEGTITKNQICSNTKKTKPHC